MNLDVSKVLKQLQKRLSFEATIDLSDGFVASVDGIRAFPFFIEGAFTGENGRYTLDLSYSGRMVFQCHRCLKAVEIEMAGKAVYPMVDPRFDSASLGFEKGLSEGADGLAEYTMIQEPILVLDAFLEESVTVDRPSHIVCSEGCKGICPTCGSDLNTEMCTCDDDRIDPRLEALKNVFT